jgi:catechol 2,3-dioxygenase-like lactoylglutathione lyase family enzyme
MDANGTTVRLSKGAKFTPAAFTVLGWDVSDIKKMVAGLRSKGARFEHFPGLEQDELGIWAAPGGTKVAWFKDPDGNILSVAQHP